MNYNKVIKDLKERNNNLQEQYRLRDIRCIHLEYENEMLKSDFEAQHELTKKYAKENKQLEHNWNELKKWLEEKINTIDIVYLGRNKKNYSEDMVLDMSSRKWSYKDSLNKMQELEEGKE